MESKFYWLDYSRKDEWQKWLSKMPEGCRDVYFNPDYAKLYEKDGISANCYVYVENDNIFMYTFMMQPVPNTDGYFDICTPYGYGGPVSNTQDHVFLREAYEGFTRETRRRKIIAELIKFHPLLNNHLLLSEVEGLNIVKMCSTVYVDTTIDESYMWKSVYTHANRKNINKANRNKIRFEIGQNDKTWEAFKGLYNKTMVSNKALKSYFFTEDYYNGIKRQLSDNYMLVSCVLDEKIIAAMIVMLGTVYAHAHLIGADREYMGTGVSNLLHHELILWCKENGYDMLRLGSGRSDTDDDMLLRFKKNFSDKLLDFYAGERVLDPKIYSEVCTSWSHSNPEKQISNRLLKYRV